MEKLFSHPFKESSIVKISWLVCVSYFLMGILKKKQSARSCDKIHLYSDIDCSALGPANKMMSTFLCFKRKRRFESIIFLITAIVCGRTLLAIKKVFDLQKDEEKNDFDLKDESVIFEQNKNEENEFYNETPTINSGYRGGITL